MCELCRKGPESDMRFGVRLCEDCLEKFRKAVSGDREALTYMANPENFPEATRSAYENIVQILAERANQLERAKQVRTEQERRVSQTRQTVNVAPNPSAESVVYKKPAQESQTDSLYHDIGGKLKGWARWLFTMGAVGAIISAISMIVSAEDGWMLVMGLLLIVVGPIMAWVSSWILYAFGELVDKTCANERNTRQILMIMRENNQK